MAPPTLHLFRSGSSWHKPREQHPASSLWPSQPTLPHTRRVPPVLTPRASGSPSPRSPGPGGDRRAYSRTAFRLFQNTRLVDRIAPCESRVVLLCGDAALVKHTLLSLISFLPYCPGPLRASAKLFLSYDPLRTFTNPSGIPPSNLPGEVYAHIWGVQSTLASILPCLFSVYGVSKA